MVGQKIGSIFGESVMQKPVLNGVEWCKFQICSVYHPVEINSGGQIAVNFIQIRALRTKWCNLELHIYTVQ